MKKKKIIIISGVVGILVVGFGIWYFVINKPQTTTINTNNAFSQNSRAFSLIEGTIADITDNTIIVNQTDGKGQKIVKVTTRTQFMETVSVDKDIVLKEGNTISVRGTDSSDAYKASEVTKSDMQLQDANQVRPTFSQGAGPNRSGNRAGRQDQSANGGTARPSGFNVGVTGKITKIDDTMITITTFQNSTRVIDISKAIFKETKVITLTKMHISDKISVNGSDLGAGIEARTIMVI